jgi:hypothetical protein
MAVVLSSALAGVSGCGRGAESEKAPAAKGVEDRAATVSDDESGSGAVAAADREADGGPRTYEVDPESLLAARLPQEEASDGWIRLFDGHTLFGWEIAGDANWGVADGAITVDSGEPCLLVTSVPWHDYELTLEFRADPDTNSGVFLRTPLRPEDPATDCFEVNIAPDEHPFPTASVVGRKRLAASEVPEPDGGPWRRMTMRLEDDRLRVSLDGAVVCELTDETGLTGGRIGLQRNEGTVAFRDIRLRPIGLESLLNESLSRWKRYPEMSGRFEVTDDGSLRVIGGKTQLESRDTFGDFTLLAEYKLAEPTTNSGIFFRSIPGDVMMGYECQISDETIDGDPLKPADCGAGGIFRRQDARIVASRPESWNSVLLVARGPRLAAWVNGIQVSDVVDQRPPDENPRRGRRLEPGTLIIQGHDETTDALYRQLAISRFPDSP